MSRARTAATLFFLLVPALGRAGDWKGEAAAGLLKTSGNTRTQSINAKFGLDYLAEQWKNSFSATALNNDSNDDSAAERYSVGDQFNYNLDPDNYLFAAVDYEKDLFGAFRERTVESVGYGRHILTGPTHLLDADIGAGARQSREQDTGVREREAIGRLGARYQWTISDTSTFSQTLKVESGADNTFSEAVSELKLSIVGNLFAGLGFTLRNNSDVPADTRKTDTISTVNLSYSFGSAAGAK